MDDSNSNISTSSSMLEDASNKSSEAPGDSSVTGLEQQSPNNDHVTTSTSFSDMSADQVATGISFQDISGGASSLTGNQSMDSSFEGDHSGDAGVFHTKRKIHGKDKKVCRVCGDKALGYNFNAMTCESCKAFFRRNALKQQTPNCMFQGNCIVDVRTRRFCPHCRLKKCFSMGMKKEMILEHGHRIRPRDKAVKKQQKTEKQKTVAQQGLVAMKKSIETVVNENKVKSEVPVDNIREPGKGVSWFQSKSWPHCSENKAGSSRQHYHHYAEQSSMKVGRPKNNRTLTDEETSLIDLLGKRFNSALKAPFAAEVPSSMVEMQDFYNTFASGYAKKVIYLIKGVEDFSQLDMEVKVNCLKGSIQCCMVLLLAYNFDKEENCFIVNDIKVRLEDLKNAFMLHKDSTEFLINLVMSMQNALFKDPCVMAIFSVVLVFSPFWDNLVQRRHLSNIQNRYLILLKHYLEAYYSYGKGKEYFTIILQKLNSLRELKNLRQAITDGLQDKLSAFAKEIW